VGVTAVNPPAVEGDVPEGYKPSEVGVIPADWSLVPLSELYDFRNGVNADKSAYGSGMRFINVLEVITKTRLTRDDIPGRVTLPEPVADAYRVCRGDILFNRTSETQEELGLAAVYDDDEPVVFGGFVIRGRAITAKVDPVYGSYALRALAVRRQIVMRGQGAIRANIGQADLRQVVLPLPPLREQRAIASVLTDMAMRLATLDDLIAKNQRFFTGILQQLLTGQVRLSNFSDEWQEQTIGDVAEVDPENLSSSTRADYAFNYISLDDVDHGRLTSYAEQVFRSAPSRARRMVTPGDVLVATVRPNLRSHLLFNISEGEWICSTGFAVVRCKRDQADPRFLFAHLFADSVNRQIDALLAGSNYPAISSGDVKSLRIRMPSYEEQRAIADVITTADAEIGALQDQRAKLLQVEKGMAHELLTGRTRLTVEAGAE
jgi:type I restriction enzyme, S subunit